jgi:hypothetical protein
MQMPEFTGSYWDNYPEWVAYWEWIRNRRFHARQEDKGIPVPHTGYSRRRKPVNGAGVSASSRVLSHHYADEGDKGRWVRKLVRNRERALWLSEWQEEQSYDPYDAETVAQWFYDNTDDMDSDVIPSAYTVGETVVEWPSDYYDPGPYNVYDYVNFDPYDFEDYGPYCAYCVRECEL